MNLNSDVNCVVIGSVLAIWLNSRGVELYKQWFHNYCQLLLIDVSQVIADCVRHTMADVLHSKIMHSVVRSSGNRTITVLQIIMHSPETRPISHFPLVWMIHLQRSTL